MRLFIALVLLSPPQMISYDERVSILIEATDDGLEREERVREIKDTVEVVPPKLVGRMSIFYKAEIIDVQTPIRTNLFTFEKLLYVLFVILMSILLLMKYGKTRSRKTKQT